MNPISKTVSRHALAVAFTVTVITALLLVLPASVAHADYTIGQTDSINADPTCALLDSSGKLNRCASNGSKADEYWRGETEAQAQYDLTGVETVFISSDTLEISKYVFDYQAESGAIKTATNYTSWYNFSTLPSLKRVVFLDSSKAVTIRSYAFRSCKNLEEITLPTSLKRIESWAFFGCNNLSTVIANKGLEFIGSGAFCDCISLKSIIIPASVDEIETHAFKGCYQLKTVKSLNATPPTIGYGVFDGASTGLKIHIPKKSYMLYSKQWNAYLNKIVDPRKAQAFTFKPVSKTITVKHSALVASSKTIKTKKAFKTANAKGEVTYEKVSGSTSYITVEGSGMIVISRGLPTGTYNLQVRATASGNANYKPSSKLVRIKMKVA